MVRVKIQVAQNMAQVVNYDIWTTQLNGKMVRIYSALWNFKECRERAQFQAAVYDILVAETSQGYGRNRKSETLVRNLCRNPKP